MISRFQDPDVGDPVNAIPRLVRPVKLLGLSSHSSAGGLGRLLAVLVPCRSVVFLGQPEFAETIEFNVLRIPTAEIRARLLR